MIFDGDQKRGTDCPEILTHTLGNDSLNRCPECAPYRTGEPTMRAYAYTLLVTDDTPDAEIMSGIECDHTYAVVNPFTGHEVWRNGPCTCEYVPVALVTVIERNAPTTRTYAETLDDLPF